MLQDELHWPLNWLQLKTVSDSSGPGGPEPNTCSAILWVFSIQLSKPTKPTQKKEKPTNYMSNTKSNLDTLIASFLLPWKVTNQSTGKEQPNNHKKPCAWILPVLQCLQNPTGFITLPGKIFAKSQKAKKFSTFRIFRIFRIVRIFRLFDFSTFRLFDFFDFFDFSSRNLLACELFDFSTFRLFEGKNRDFHGVTDTSQRSTQFWIPFFSHQVYDIVKLRTVSRDFVKPQAGI